jgi:hypothetical protein
VNSSAGLWEPIDFRRLSRLALTASHPGTSPWTLCTSIRPSAIFRASWYFSSITSLVGKLMHTGRFSLIAHSIAILMIAVVFPLPATASIIPIVIIVLLHVLAEALLACAISPCVCSPPHPMRIAMSFSVACCISAILVSPAFPARVLDRIVCFLHMLTYADQTQRRAKFFLIYFGCTKFRPVQSH